MVILQQQQPDNCLINIENVFQSFPIQLLSPITYHIDGNLYNEFKSVYLQIVQDRATNSANSS